MSQARYPIHYWESPQSDQVGENLNQFLEQLEGPTWMYFPGQDGNRCRVVTTLLHGNEPSGMHAIHQWILANETPAVDLYCFIGSVTAAKHTPGFHHRMLPGRRDLNRCFRPPYNDEEGLVAADLLHRINSVRPEAVIDIHNTSGSGPAFAISTRLNAQHQAICQLFTERLIITDIRLGSLMEFEGDFPITTIECGGAHDPHAHQLAWDGLRRFAHAEQLFTDQDSAEMELAIFRHPIRVELIKGSDIAYAEQPISGVDLTLHAQVERYNFGEVPAGTHLGWLGAAGLGSLMARDTAGYDHINHFFDCQDNRLLTRQPLKLFMITKNASIALSDCLFYLVPLISEYAGEH